jgi:hypothetical protein
MALPKRIGIIACFVICSIAVGIGGLFLLAHNLKASMSYCVEATFSELPANDEAFTEWLKNQHGIVPNTVHVRRFGDEVEVGFIQVRTITGDPPFPNLEQECAELGYRLASGRFRDCKNRYR